MFLHMKTGILQQLIRLLYEGCLPISWASMQSAHDDHYGQVKTVTFDLMLNPKEKWDKSLFAELKKRWDNGELQKQLSSLKDLMDNLRSEIAKSFTSDELLIALQSSRSTKLLSNIAHSRTCARLLLPSRSWLRPRP